MRSHSELKVKAYVAAFVCFATAVLFAGIPAHAGNLSYLKDAPIAKFNDEDVQLMTSNAQAVLADAKTPLSRSWANSKTNHSGTAESLLEFLGPKGIPCKRLRVTQRADGRESKATYTYCNMDAEGWRMVSSEFAPTPKKPPVSAPTQ
jgi:hypothetical protein